MDQAGNSSGKVKVGVRIMPPVTAIERSGNRTNIVGAREARVPQINRKASPIIVHNGERSIMLWLRAKCGNSRQQRQVARNVVSYLSKTAISETRKSTTRSNGSKPKA